MIYCNVEIGGIRFLFYAITGLWGVRDGLFLRSPYCWHLPSRWRVRFRHLSGNFWSWPFSFRGRRWSRFVWRRTFRDLRRIIRHGVRDRCRFPYRSYPSFVWFWLRRDNWFAASPRLEECSYHLSSERANSHSAPSSPSRFRCCLDGEISLTFRGWFHGIVPGRGGRLLRFPVGIRCSPARFRRSLSGPICSSQWTGFRFQLSPEFGTMCRQTAVSIRLHSVWWCLPSAEWRFIPSGLLFAWIIR